MLEQIQESLSTISVGTEEMQEKVSTLSESDEMLKLLAASTQINEQTANLSSGISQISDGLSALNQQYAGLDGLKGQNSSSAEYLRGLASQAASIYGGLDDSVKAMVQTLSGSVDVDGIISNLNNIAGLLETDNSAFDSLGNETSSLSFGASEAAGAATLSENYTEFDKQLQTLPVLMKNLISDQMTDLTTAINTLTEEYRKLDGGIGEYTAGADQIQPACVRKQFPCIRKQQYFRGNKKMKSGTSALSSGSSSLLSGINKIQNGLGNFKNGVTTLSSGIFSLDEGAGTLNEGAGTLYDGTAGLHDGLTELADGTDSMKSGTEEFSDKTKDIDTQIDDAVDEVIDKISGSDFTPVSFTSSENKEIGLVQFAMKTEGITVQDQKDEVITEKENKSIIQKLKEFF